MAEKHRALRTLAVALAVAALLVGCRAPSVRPEPAANPAAGSQTENSNPASPNVPLPPQRAAPPPRENHLSAATSSLVTQARTLVSRGDLDSASATLDRALRIEPNNPLVWIELGRLRLAENDAHQAEGCARKALSVASGDRSTQAQAGRLLADALRAERRNEEALEVERQPYMR